MPALFADFHLVNGSTGDPVLFVTFPGRGTALLFDGGENGSLSMDQLSQVEALFITHHHPDHFVGVDRVVRANNNTAKTLSVFGPEGTLRRIQQRLAAYVFPKFDFTKLVVRVHDMLPGKVAYSDLALEKDFALGVVHEVPWAGPKVYSNDDVEVECCFTDHTLPGLAYALVEKPGFHPDPQKLQKFLLRPGKWVGEALQLVRSKAPIDTVLNIEGLECKLGWLKDKVFSRSQGGRIAFIVDTLFSDAVKPDLIRLASKAKRLYCDSYYSAAHDKRANTYKHMMAPQSAELATLAGVEELVLIHFSPSYAGRYHTLLAEARTGFARVSAEF